MNRYVKLFILMVVQVLLIQTSAEPFGMSDLFSDNLSDSEPADPYGYFTIVSDPAGADIIFDSMGQGMTPVQVKILTTDPASHMITIRKDGYQEWTSQVNHNPLPGSTEEISAVLIPVPAPISQPPDEPALDPVPEPTREVSSAGSFLFISDPPGAEVIFDGSNQGVTPVLVEVTASANPDNQVIIRKDGFQDWTRTITDNPDRGETEEIKAELVAVPAPTKEPVYIPTREPEPEPVISPGPQTANFLFTSNPTGAEVLFDDSSLGNTPVLVEVNITDKPDHTVSIRKEGYEIWKTPITHNPDPGVTEEIKAELEPQTGPNTEPTGKPEPVISPDLQTANFSFTSNPIGAEVIFDDSSLGNTPVLAEVRLTDKPDHTVIIRKDGYEEWITPITHNPDPGVTEEINAELVPQTGPTGKPTGEPTFNPVVNPVNDTEIGTGFFLVESLPSGALVKIDGSSRGTTPVTVEINRNETPEHFIQVHLSGYQDWTMVIHSNPPAGETEKITAELIAVFLNGSIRVTSEPPVSLVVLDGSATQTTPCNFTDVPAGMHTIGISKDGYNPYSTNVTVSVGAESVVSAVLSPVISAGSLTVSSNPDGALILLNNIAYGFTPAHFDAIVPGTYQMKLVKHGYQPVSRTVEIIAGKDTPVTAYLPRFVPPTGTLVIRSFPSGGIVKVDAEEKGITPLKIRGLLPDSYNVRVSIPGYLSWIGIVDITPGRETSIYATLTPKGQVMDTGSLSITSDPTGGTVMIDNYSQGRTPLLLQNLLPGQYQVTLLFPGYERKTVTARVNAGKTTNLHVSISPIPVKNLSADLIMLSDDAAGYFRSHGRTESLTAFEDPSGGFFRDGMYVIGLDLNGTVISNSKKPDLDGKNLSDLPGEIVNTGMLMTSLARTGGGLFYDTCLSDSDPRQVSLIYVRPALSGVVIGTVIQVPEILFPGTSDTDSLIRDAVHDTVIEAREKNEDDITVMALNVQEEKQEIQVHNFDTRLSENPDRYGIMNSQVMHAASAMGTGYLWLLDDTGAESYHLIQTYAEMIDGNRGVYASSEPIDDEAIAMVDIAHVTI